MAISDTLRHISLLASLLILHINGMAKPLCVGDKVPELYFNNLINYTSTSARLSDFKGKAIIIDFWATWCGPCVAGFPKLNTFQKEHSNELQIMLVAQDYKNLVTAFFESRADIVIPSEVVDMSDRDNLLLELFPHTYVPHYIWINKEGYIIGITGAEEATEKNLIAFIEGNELRLENKNTQFITPPVYTGITVDSIEKVYGIENRISFNPLIQYQSMLTKYDERVTTGISRNVINGQPKMMDIRRFPIPGLFAVAYLGMEGFATPKKIFDFKDSTVASPIGVSRNKYQEWEKTHTYCYRLVMPPGTDSTLFMATMQRDITNSFDYTAGMENRVVDCYVLKASGDLSKLATNVTEPSLNASIYFVHITNGTIAEFTDALGRFSSIVKSGNWRMPLIPIVDETGYKGKIDLQFNANLNDLEEINNELKKYNLQLTLEKKEIACLVIREK